MKAVWMSLEELPFRTFPKTSVLEVLCSDVLAVAHCQCCDWETGDCVSAIYFLMTPA